MKGLGASSRIFELLDARPLTVKLGVGRPLPVTTPPRRIIFDNVHFAYPSRPDSEVLRGVNLTIEPGMIYSIAGGSGSGKSTIANLLERFYDPTSGRVLYGDDNIAEYTPESWRQRIAIVPQDPALFSATIAENSKSRRPPEAVCWAIFKLTVDVLCLSQSPTADRMLPAPRLKKLLGSPTAALSRLCRTALRPKSARGVRNSLEASVSVWRSPVPSCRSRESWSATSAFRFFFFFFFAPPAYLESRAC